MNLGYLVVVSDSGQDKYRPLNRRHSKRSIGAHCAVLQGQRSVVTRIRPIPYLSTDIVLLQCARIQSRARIPSRQDAGILEIEKFAVLG